MNPVLVEVLRGGHVESAHRGALAVLDADGGVVASVGDIGRAVFPRSAVKLLQALALVESGAAERLGLTDAELALACASHGGEPEHVRTAASMLAKAGADAATLECGTHWPYHEAASRSAGTCVPHSRSASLRPAAASMRVAVSTWRGSPLCDAHASASSASPKP